MPMFAMCVLHVLNVRGNGLVVQRPRAPDTPVRQPDEGSVGPRPLEALRQGEHHEGIRTPPVVAAADCYGDVLLSIHRVRHRRGAGARGELTAPELTSRLDVERAKVVIER